MIKVEKLRDNQPEAAEKLLRELYGQHDDKEVLATQLATLLASRGELKEAQEILVDFLRRKPDEPRALICLAEIVISSDGFTNNRRLVHRAFQLAARTFPAGVSQLASRVAAQMAQLGCTLSVREHLALAVRMSPTDRRNTLLMQLANFESQRTVPYPFRGRMALLPVELTDEKEKQDELRARRVSQIGCWEPAAILYKRLAEKHPECGEIWHNIGLFHAWDGRIQESVAALHKAAELLEDFDLAAETSAVAQLLEMDIAQDGYGVVQLAIPVSSVSELLTRLDTANRFARVPESSEDDAEGRVAAEYELLSAEFPQGGSAEDLPDVQADVTIVDKDSELGGSQALIVALDGELDDAVAEFREVAGDLAVDVADDQKSTLSRMPNQCLLFDWKIHHPASIGSGKHRALNHARAGRALQKWLETKLPGLEDATPIEAAKDANNLVKVAGAVITLDVLCNRMGYDSDLSEVRSRLGVPSPSVLKVEETENLTSLPLLKFARVNVQDLSDPQIIDYTNRITLIRHQKLLSPGLEELAKRPAALEKFTPMRAHLLRASVAREYNEYDKASECFEDARVAVQNEEDAFRIRLELDIRELSCRLDEPEDAKLPELLAQLRDRYFTKIPEIEGVIREELMNSNCEHLLDQLSPAVVAASGSESDKTSKLWLPGQD